MRPLVNMAVIGAQKAGSTALQNAIARHPEIRLPSSEEPYFEREDLPLGKADPYFRRKYGRSFGRAPITGVKRPNYLASEKAPSRLQQYNPNTKLIVVLRDPVSRAISSYLHSVRLGFLPVEEVNVGLTKVFNGDYDRHSVHARETREFGLYAQCLMRWKRYFPQEQLHVIRLDDVLGQPEQVLKAVYHFFGVSLTVNSEDFQSANEGAYTYEALRYYESVSRCFFQYDDLRAHRKFVIPISPFQIVRGGYALMRARQTRKDRRLVIKPDAEVKDFINRYYENDLVRLSDEWGIAF